MQDLAKEVQQILVSRKTSSYVSRTVFGVLAFLRKVRDITPTKHVSPNISWTGPGTRGACWGFTAQKVNDMSSGTVKWFNVTKGYGFITPDDGGKDVFVHISAVERAGLTTLREGARVDYELQTGRNGKDSAEGLKVTG